MAIACDLTIDFATSGNSLGFLGGGWARSEDNFTWAIGHESHLVLPRIQSSSAYILTLDVIPYVHLPRLQNQRLIVSINNIVIGSASLSRPTRLGYRLPTGVALGTDKLAVTLQHPDAARPCDLSDSADDRPLAFALSKAKLSRVTDTTAPAHGLLPAGLMLGPSQNTAFNADSPASLTDWATARTGLTVPQIAIQFESIGENCEFGLFQRRCDAEPLGLLRFSSTFMRNLIRGIETGFAGLGEIEDIDPRLEGTPRREFMIHENKFELVYHTFVYEGERSIWMMREQESARLKFLRRKFLEDLESSDKIFVYKLGSGVSDEEILPLHMALNLRGSATLLWVVQAEASRPAGTVEVLMRGLLKGYIDRFAPEDDAHDFSFAGWLQVCANACALVRLERAAAQAGEPIDALPVADDPVPLRTPRTGTL